MNVMSQKIAITGGIGSGKTFICHLLTARGIKIVIRQPNVLCVRMMT